MGLFDKIKAGIKKTRDAFFGQIDSLFGTFSDDALFDNLEELLIAADVGVTTSQKICLRLKKEAQSKKTKDSNEIKKMFKNIIEETLSGDNSLKINTKPSVILVIGVNGVGKTTTIGKLAYKLKNDGKKVILAAADTFRAAAIEQLEIWGQQSGCQVIKHTENSDPAAVVFDAISAAKSRDADVIICDTAGRLHNKNNLVSELNKINKVINRELPDADKENMLVLDATTGQNAINQAKVFNKTVNLTGIILTKLDGTAKGGIIIAIKEQLNIPIKFIGLGEKIDNLQVFDSELFTQALFENII